MFRFALPRLSLANMLSAFFKKIARFKGSFQSVKESNKLFPLISETTDRKAIMLIKAVPVDIAIVYQQVAIQRIR
jgi:hypothetical protein